MVIKKSPHYLHLGCGLTTPDGWLNVDGSWQVLLAKRPWVKRFLVALHLLPKSRTEIPWSAEVMHWNLTKPLPFADGSFVAVYSSHLLEHLYNEDAISLLKECRRVLVKGGVCRIVVPDVESIVRRYKDAKVREERSACIRFMEELGVHEKSPLKGPLGLYYGLTAFNQHKWMYDADSLKGLFEEAGFLKIRCADYLDSLIARIADVENGDRLLNGNGVAVEGIKE